MSDDYYSFCCPLYCGFGCLQSCREFNLHHQPEHGAVRGTAVRRFLLFSLSTLLRALPSGSLLIRRGLTTRIYTGFTTIGFTTRLDHGLYNHRLHHGLTTTPASPLQLHHSTTTTPPPPLPTTPPLSGHRLDADPDRAHPPCPPPCPSFARAQAREHFSFPIVDDIFSDMHLWPNRVIKLAHGLGSLTV